MTHKFIVNDDSNVNEYGYRVMTKGLDTVQYERNPIVLFMHNRALDDPKKVVGKCVSLTKKGSQLIAEIQFDENEKFAKSLASKVEGGFIQMASIYADVIQSSIEPEDLLPGQIYETVVQSKLIEISIVDVGGNDNALKLSRGGLPVELKKITSLKTNDMSLKTIALSMGLKEDASEAGVLKAFSDIKLAKEQAEKQVTELSDQLKSIKDAEKKALIDKAVQLSLIPEALISVYQTAFDTDYQNTKVALSKQIEEAEGQDNLKKTNDGLKQIVLSGGQQNQRNEKLTYDYLQKNDPVQLGKIRQENPEEYVRLAKEYESGVRHQQ